MAEAVLAERTASELRDGGKRRIQVRNLLQPELFVSRLSSLMEDIRFITFNFSHGEPWRKALSDYFTGTGLPDPGTAFEAGWRSHLTETALLGGGKGMESASGLTSLKDPLKRFLLGGENSFDALPRILSSFTGTLPTVFILLDYRSNSLFDSSIHDFPPVVALTAGQSRLTFHDLDLDSGLMPMASVKKYLQESGCCCPLERVIRATGGRAGLVRLFTGISSVFNTETDCIWEMLHGVLDRNCDLADFAAAAAVLAPGFIPSEAAALSSRDSEAPFILGRKINLWRGFRVADFSSPEVREQVLSRIDETQLNRLLSSAAETVISHRGRSAVSLGFAGELLFRAGACEEASLLFTEAAELEHRELKRAELYRKALIAHHTESDVLGFRVQLSLFRERAGSAPEFIPDTLSGCDFPELSQTLQDAEEKFNGGMYHRAYRQLADFALQSENNLSVALVEIGRQLLRRNMVESSLNVMKAAAATAAEAGCSWLEAQALETYMKVCNRTGRFRESRGASGRLIELALDSGNRLKLVHVYNLYANSLILQTEYEKALKVYQSSLRTLEADQQGLRAVILNNMSIAQRRLFRTDEALGSLMRFARSAVSQGNLLQASTAYGNMARLFIDLSRFDSAADCLETMLEFRNISGADPSDDSVLFISAQIAFAQGQTSEALSLMDEAVRTATISGNLRRLSLNLVKKGSMLLRMEEYVKAAEVLCRAEEASCQSNSMLNLYVARMKGTAARCFSGIEEPASILSVQVSGTPEDTHRGEQFYYHWRLTGSRQSLSAAVQFLSRGLARGLHYHSYLHMLHEIVEDLPASLADVFPLVHNYPSCVPVKGD